MTLRRFLSIFVVGGALAFGASAPVIAENGEGRLILSVILTRHGVRSQNSTNERIGRYAREPWPNWEVAPGILTPHGGVLMERMGAYYRDLYVRGGLLSGDATADAGVVYLRADSDERTLETARRLGLALLPGVGPEVHGLKEGQPDRLFKPSAGADWGLAAAAVMGRIGGSPEALAEANRDRLDLMKRVLFGGTTVPAGKVSPFTSHPKPKPEDAFRSIDLGEVSGTVASFAEAFLLEYADGMPMSQVGWGRVDRSTITELLGIHSAYFDLMYRTPYRAQVEASNLALHMMATLEQAASGRPEAGAIGPVGSRLVIIVGHDGNVASVGGLLGLSWIIDGSQPNPLYPGGALDFELRRDPDGHLFVRAFYVAQTLDQMRGADVLSVDHPPARSAIFIPGASEAKPGYDAPLDKLRALVANRARSEWFESTDGLLP